MIIYIVIMGALLGPVVVAAVKLMIAIIKHDNTAPNTNQYNRRNEREMTIDLNEPVKQVKQKDNELHTPRIFQKPETDGAYVDWMRHEAYLARSKGDTTLANYFEAQTRAPRR